ncbi:MAG: GIY-YIG nuclease family protein [Coleofasciculaceae cyanobacterium]
MTSGYLYILSNPAFKDNLLKIGYTERNVSTRAKELYQTGVPDRFNIVYAEDVENPVEIEKIIHNKLADFRYNKNREFFEIPIQEAISKVQEVTQRLIYQKGLHILKENTAFRWMCQHRDVVFLIRYIIADEPQNNPIVDFWVCEETDQILITNIPEEDKVYLGEDKLITLTLNKFKNDGDIDPINGSLHGVCEIHPRDRIVWLTRAKDNSNIDEYYIHSIVNCQIYGIFAGFSNLRKTVFEDDIFLPFGYDPSIEDIVGNLRQPLQQALRKIEKDWEQDICNSPDDGIGRLYHELITMSKNCPKSIYSFNRIVYLGKNQKRVKDIGERLNQIGGFHLMIIVARQIPDYDIRELEFAWDKIGDWRA